MDQRISQVSPKNPARQRRWPNRLLLAAALLWLLALAAVVGVALYEARYARFIYPGVWASYVDLSGMTRAQAESKLLSSELALPSEPVLIRYGERTWRISPEELHMALDAQGTAERAFQVGRGGSLLRDLREQANAYLHTRIIDPVFTLFDNGFLAYSVALMAQDINQSTREARLTVQGLEVQAAPGQAGVEVDQGATLEALRQRFVGGGGGEVELVVRVTPPALADLSQGEAMLRRILAAPVELEYAGEGEGRHAYTISRETLAEWLRWDLELGSDGQPVFSAGLEEAGVRAWAEGVAAELARPVQDARFELDVDTVTLIPVVPSVWGRELDVDETVRLIREQANAETRVMVTLPVSLIKPTLAMEDAPNMGVKELVAQESTVFKGSSASRVKNITLAAARFNNVLVPPDGVFSFNEHLGEVSKETGYDESLVILGDSTVVGYGGGVCQVSTTAFRTALFGGFPIVERYAHAYVVGWYGEPGMDATVYAPYTDFRFRNDTEHYLMIMTDVDAEAGTITFSFYGTSDGRKVEITPPVKENLKPAPPPVYTYDPSLAAGTVKQVDWAVGGMDVTITRTVQISNTLVSEDAFFSRFEPWAAKYLYGDGAELPSGITPEPTATPEATEGE